MSDGVNAPTMVYFPPDQLSAYSTFLGFESEAFYYMARSVFNTKLGKAKFLVGIEAGFVPGLATPTQEMIFARFRLTCPVRDVGIYTLYHPWGAETVFSAMC